MTEEKRGRGRPKGSKSEKRKPEEIIKERHEKGKGPAYKSVGGRIYKYKNRPLYNDADYLAEKCQEYIDHLHEEEITGGQNYFSSWLGLGHRRVIDKLKAKSDEHRYIIEQVESYTHSAFENNCIKGGGAVVFRLKNGAGYKDQQQIDQTVTQRTIVVKPKTEDDDSGEYTEPDS